MPVSPVDEHPCCALGEALVEEDPTAYYRPPCVGNSGWIGIELDRVSDEALDGHIRGAWQIIDAKKTRKKKMRGSR